VNISGYKSFRKEKIIATEMQINANRQNALKSTGPRTPEGKEAAGQNAIKHGLRATKNVIKTENQDDFVLFRDKMIADISPYGAMEEMLAERIVSLSWRLKRAEHFQNAVIDALIEHGLHGASSGFGWTSENRERATKEAAAGDVDVMLGIVINHDFANSKTLDMLLSYERRIESSLYRAIAELKKMRRMRKENEENGICTNEANLKDESSESHPHPEKDVQDEAATHIKENRTQDTENRIFQVASENNTCTNEPNLEEAEAMPTDATQENEKCTNEANPPSQKLQRTSI
jgi:hypothetical protein